MTFHETKLPGVYEIRLKLNSDERGFFARSWCQKEFEDHGLNSKVVQCNVSFNARKGTLRGIHYQATPYPETKVVRCTMGSIHDVVVDLRPQEVAIASGLPSPKVDPRLISQVIFTLLENAAKYSVSSARITISVRQKENNICFAVDDEGPGIPSELRGQVFEKFFRAGFQPGFGMGLAIARGIVQAHGGKIWIEDGPDGKGTSVQFMIPLNDAPFGDVPRNEVSQKEVPQNDLRQNDDVSMTKSSLRAGTPGDRS